MMPNDFGHAFAQIARTTSDIQNALTAGQIELPNCLQTLRHHIPCEIGFLESFCSFLGEFKPAHLRLPPSMCIPGVDDRRVLNGIFWVSRSGVRAVASFSGCHCFTTMSSASSPPFQ